MTMPLSKLFQFEHCAILWSGVPTKWTVKTRTERAQEREAVEWLKAQRAAKEGAK